MKKTNFAQKGEEKASNLVDHSLVTRNKEVESTRCDKQNSVKQADDY